MRISLPRFVNAKRISTGIAYYWNPPLYWKKQAETAGRKYPFTSQPLGADLRQVELDAAAERYNTQFDEWRQSTGGAGMVRRYAAHGSVEWLLETYIDSEIFRRRVKPRSRPDYRRLLDRIMAVPTKDGRTFGKLPVQSVTPAAAEKIYAKMIEGDKFRTGEKAVMYCKTVWRLLQPHHPREFRRDVPNPWVGVQLITRTKKRKRAVTRDEVYLFAKKAIELQQPHLGAAAVVCFEWLQRPENVLGGYIGWGDYRGRDYPNWIRIEHHKTGDMVLHPLEEKAADGARVLFYEDAEQILAACPHHGLAMICRPDGTHFTPTRFAQLVRVAADAAGLPKHFSLDACRHGGMTELEEAELTDGQGRALSAHRSRAYEGYAKRTEKRALAATRRRHAYLMGGSN